MENQTLRRYTSLAVPELIPQSMTDKAYEHYITYCRLLSITPASKSCYLHETKTIAEIAKEKTSNA